MFKIITIVGTRPEIIKLSRLINELKKHVNHILVHTGQNYDYELNEIFFKELKIDPPDYYLNCAGNTVASTIGNIIYKTDEVLDKEKPDAFIVYGDTNSCLSVISAKRRKIPVFHFEAGNRSFDQRIPEELNRKVIDHLSDINFPVTEHARRYLINEGIDPKTIIKSGSPMKEILDFHSSGIKKSKILKNLKVDKNKYFVISLHREENVDNLDNFNTLLESFNSKSSEITLAVDVSAILNFSIKLLSLLLI